MTRDEIMQAANAGADLTVDAMAEAGYLGAEAAANVANLIVCAIGTVLDNSDATMVDVVAENFQGSAEQWRTELGDAIVDAAIARQESGA